MPCRTVLPKKPQVAQLLIQFPVFYKTCQFITIFPTASLYMADAPCSQASTGSNIDDICGVIKGSDCVMCYNLKIELESVLQELSSARKIIQILQDDVKKEAKDRTAIPEDHQGVKDILQRVNSQSTSEEAGQKCWSQKIHTVKTKGFKILTIVNGKKRMVRLENVQRQKINQPDYQEI